MVFFIDLVIRFGIWMLLRKYFLPVSILVVILLTCAGQPEFGFAIGGGIFVFFGFLWLVFDLPNRKQR